MFFSSVPILAHWLYVQNDISLVELALLRKKYNFIIEKHAFQGKTSFKSLQEFVDHFINDDAESGLCYYCSRT